jgi:WD40 repeat protein/class 3 adenylate cyclase
MADDTSVFGGTVRADDAHIRTFLIADVRGYTVFTQERGDEAAALLAGKFAAVAREVVEARSGSVVELRGDEALAVFDSARQAIRASVDLQRRFVDETVAEPTLPLAVGIGLDAGEAVPVDGGYRGGALNLAARLCSIAGPAEILASPAVAHLARKVEGVAYVDRGPVQLKGLKDPVHVIRLRAEADDAADDIAFRRALGAAAPRLAPSAPGAIAANPYKGLRAFEEADAVDFFGREELVEQLVKRLGTTRFLAVVGPSGSGKSSVVRAGLLPALRRGAVPRSDTWRIVDMFPGTHPLDGLEAALLRSVDDPPASLIEQLSSDEHGLHRAILRLLPADGSELLLVIDQFEEVFTLVEDEAARAHFLGSLETAATDPHSRLRVVITLRADFYDRPLLYRGFADLFKSRVEALVPLSPEELERAISGPAERVDVSLEPGLVAAMLADVAEEPGALPLMEYALTELFDRREGRVLTLAAYREIGGVSGALGRRAEELFADLDDQGNEAARQLFLRLVTLGEGTEDTRRRVPRSEVASLDVDQRAMATVLDTFGASRQLSFDRDAGSGAPTIELAHEAMITAWPRLHRWIDAAREDLRTERRMAAAAHDWVEADREPSFLLSGSRLEQAEAWAAGSGLAITPEEREYLEASRAERDRTTAEETARAARERDLERRSVRRLRVIVAVLAAAALVAAGLTVLATGARRDAVEQERNATARELAAASVANLEIDPERSILLALEAVDVTRSADGTVLREAEEALHRALTASRIVLTESGIGGAVDWSAKGVFVTEGPEGTGTIDIRDAATADSVRTWQGHDIDVNDVRFSDDGSLLATGGDDGALRIWNPDDAELISEIVGEHGAVAPSFDADGSLVAASWPEEGAVRVAEPDTGRTVREIEGLEGFPFDTALSPDGDRVAVGMEAVNEAWVFDVASGDVVFKLTDHLYPVGSVSWSPDGLWIATGSFDSSVRIWNADGGKLEERLQGHPGIVNSVDWAPDSRRLVSAGSEGTARVWEIEEHTGPRGNELESHEVFTLTAQESQSGSFAAFSPDGARVITSDLGITSIKIWDLSVRGDEELANMPTNYFAPADAAYLPDGRVVASDGNGAVAIWATDGTHDATIGSGGGGSAPVTMIAVAPDGTMIATAGFDDVVSVWNTETGDPVFEFDVSTKEGESVSSIDWSPDGQHLAAASTDGRVTVTDRQGEVVNVFSEAPHRFGPLAFSPDGRSIAVGTFNEEDPETSHVSIWEWQADDAEPRSIGHGASALEFDPTGSTLVVGLFDGSVEIRDVATGDLVRRFGTQGGEIRAVDVSPDGTRIATAGEDGTVVLSDPRTGKQMLVLPGHDLLVFGLAFSPDGRQVVSAAPDGDARVWALDLDELIDIANDEATRELTDEECRQYLHQPNGCE